MRPSARTLLPLAGLVGLGTIVGLALRRAPAIETRFGGLPPPGDVRAAEPDVGLATLRGTLVDHLGQPVVGAALVVERAGRPIWTFSDARGRFELAELDPGATSVAVTHEAFGARTVPALAGDEPVVLELGEPLPGAPELRRPPAHDLDGRVGGGPPGSFEGFELALLPLAPPERPGGGVPRRADLDGDGRFAVDALTAGEYELLLLPPWARGGTWPDLLSPLDHPPLRYSHPPEDDPERELELDLIAGEIAGRVLEADGRAPLEGGMITVLPVLGRDGGDAESRRLPPTRTDRDGTFRVPWLAPGRYAVELVAGGDRRRAVVVVPQGGTVDPEL